MSAEITQLRVTYGDITRLVLNSGDITNLTVQSNDTTVISAVTATINAASLSLSSATPLDVARTGSAGTSTQVSRADHIHSIANTLLDGGNY